MGTMKTPAPFKNKNLIAECYEYGNGERGIKIYNKNLTTYTPAKAQIYDPIMAFKFAAWLVKASEWMGEQQIYKSSKKNIIQPTKD
jgi:hypothetical protein